MVKKKIAYVIAGKKKVPFGLYHRGLQKQVNKHGVVLYEVTLSAHSLIFSLLNIIVQTVEKKT